MYLSPPPPALTALASSPGVFFHAADNGTDDGRDPSKDLTAGWSSLIGITTAIVGNVLIALALNVQRYAHIRLHRHRAQVRDRARQALKNAANGRGTVGGGGGYGTVEPNAPPGPHDRNGHRNGDTGASETDPLAASYQSGDSRWTECSDDAKAASTYLQSPYWWLGQVLITVGEMGNFLAYGFAPASIVSPLGVVALISNCVIAPILFKEKFRHRDFWGVIVAIAGAVTVVLSAKQNETKLAPHDVWDAISTMEFEIYVGVTCTLIILLMWASPRYGHRTILIDLGLVGLYGGYTVLATKGVSSMLSSTLFGAFTYPVTYVLVVILLSTAVMQVRYVNKALQRFDSTQVIPIQFVMFTLCVIIGSAVLYRDFERTTAEQAAKFVGGCLLTFFGVFLITSGRSHGDDEDDGLSDVDGVEETIGLAEHGPGTPQTPGQPHRQDDGSTRSKKSSRVSFKEAISRSFNALSDTGIPSLRRPAASSSKDPMPVEGEGSPLLRNPWRDSAETSPVRPPMGTQIISSDSVFTGTSSAPPSNPASPLAGDQMPLITSVTSPNERPTTPPPRPSLSSARPHSHHFQGTMISPSPLGSTVSAVVADHLRKHMDAPLLRRIQARRSRPSLRSSLFVPHDELDERHPPADAAMRPDQRQDPPDQGDADDAASRESPHKGFRGRARSLSNTLSELLGGGRRRRKSMPSESEDEGGTGSNGNGGRGQPAAAVPGSTETL